MYSDNNYSNTTPTQPYQAVPGEPRRRRGGAGPAALVGAVLLGGIAGGVAGHLTAPAATQTVVERTVTTTAGPASPASSATGLPPLRAVDTSDRVVDVVRRVGPAVVTIQTSGVIVDAQGDILTNNHVIDSADPANTTYTVVFKSGAKVNASLVRQAAYTDLAVIHVDAKVPAYAELGDSAQAQPGETVLAIGNPLGSYQNTVTEGIISAVGRTLQESSDVTLNNLLQTDAAINHGNSGGPLVDLNGRVIGINTAVVRSSSTTNNGQQDPFGGLFGPTSPDTSDQAQGLGFAIPSMAARALVYGVTHHIMPGYLGVMSNRMVDPQTSTYYNIPVGAVVSQVEPNTPAAKAGLRVKDIITAIDGQAIDQNNDLHTVVAQHQPGETVKIVVWRGGRTLTLDVKLAARPSSARP